MSFLDEQPDDTLAAAFALIDSCDAYLADDDRTTESSSCSPSSSGGGGGFSSSDVRSTDDDADSDDTNGSSSAPSSSSMGASAGGGRNASLRVVIRTTNNKKLAVDAAHAPAPHHPHAHAPYKRLPPSADERPASYRNKNSVLRFRARKKEEAALLREEAAALEAQLAQLRGSRSARPAAADVDNSGEQRSDCQALVVAAPTTAAAGKKKANMWMEVAAVQARERFAAEALNQQLQAAVQQQRAMGSALEAMLRATAEAKKNNFGMHLLSDAQKQSVYNDQFGTVEHRRVLALHASSAEMRRRFDAVFQDASSVSAASLSTAMVPGHPDAGADAGGSYVEIRTSAPMRCDFRVAGEMIWKLVSTPGPVAMRTYSLKRDERTESSYLKIYTLYLGRPGGTVEVHGCSLVTKSVSANRFALTWTSSLTASSATGPTFLERGWVAVTRSPSGNRAFPSVLQVCHQVFSNDHMSGRPCAYPESAEEAEVREFVLGHIVRRTRTQYQHIQSFLTDLSGKLLAYTKTEKLAPEVLSC